MKNSTIVKFLEVLYHLTQPWNNGLVETDQHRFTPEEMLTAQNMLAAVATAVVASECLGPGRDYNDLTNGGTNTYKDDNRYKYEVPRRAGLAHDYRAGVAAELAHIFPDLHKPDRKSVV